MYEITMPRLSDSMEEGKIVRWRAKEGQDVREGDILAEIESDKAVMELECFHDGRVSKIVKGDGAEAPVGEVIALVASKSEIAAVGAARRPAATAEAATPMTEAAPPRATTELTTPATAARQPAPVGASSRTPPSSQSPPAGRRIAISPYARRLAEAMGVDYTRVAGTGDGGRIMARDIEMASERSAPAGPPRAPGKPEAARPPDEELPPLELDEGEADVEEAPFRLKTQARRTTAAKHVIPHFYVTVAADVTSLLQARAELKPRIGATVTHLVILACVKAIARRPEVNRSYDHGHVIRWKNVNLGLAVQTDEGLTVAVLGGAQRLKLDQIVARTTALAERARAGRLAADERRHATFTISNLGMFDVEHFAPILNPPSAVTLGVSSAADATVIRDGGIYIGKVMRLTASCDHRILDGVTAARFLKDLKDLLENPRALLEETT